MSQILLWNQKKKGLWRSSHFLSLICNYYRCLCSTQKLVDGDDSYNRESIVMPEENESLDQATDNIEPIIALFNYQSFMNKAPTAKWSKQDTELFYEVRSIFDCCLLVGLVGLVCFFGIPKCKTWLNLTWVSLVPSLHVMWTAGRIIFIIKWEAQDEEIHGLSQMGVINEKWKREGIWSLL